MNAADLIAFEDEVARKIAAKEIYTPTHLCGGNEEDLIEIFKRIDLKEDWVFATYRNHYHALLFGVPEEVVMRQIIHGRSMTPCYPGFKCFTSAMVGGTLPIAVGVAAGSSAIGALSMSGASLVTWLRQLERSLKLPAMLVGTGCRLPLSLKTTALLAIPRPLKCGARATQKSFTTPTSAKTLTSEPLPHEL